jgi:hypothetical protein
MTIPGNPAPEPRSSQTPPVLPSPARGCAQAAGGSTSSRSCNESATWRVQSDGMVDREMRFIRDWQASRSSTKRSKRSSVSRETSTTARAFSRSPLRSIAVGIGLSRQRLRRREGPSPGLPGSRPCFASAADRALWRDAQSSLASNFIVAAPHERRQQYQGCRRNPVEPARLADRPRPHR